MIATFALVGCVAVSCAAVAETADEAGSGEARASERDQDSTPGGDVMVAPVKRVMPKTPVSDADDQKSKAEPVTKPKAKRQKMRGAKKARN